MKNSSIAVMLVTAMVLLTGCGMGNAAEHRQSSGSYIGFVTQVEAQELLINDTWFSVQDAVVINGDGDEIPVKDVGLGDKIKVEADGEISESHPRRAEAAKMSLFSDEGSMKECHAVRLVLQDPRFSEVLLHSVTKEVSGVYDVRFTDPSIGTDVKVMVNLQHERVMVPARPVTQ
ncbi:hypothetical protein [Rossellomorea marisflavi]|uniref:hypothetical protein n=1 Tax=Rossellomorea marisflavi TaxID=189381 RepID=UPI0011E85B8D|nr:hypothetical protein [Rossellomorea marisflavi]TYO73016.1 hypothetical protein DQ398_001927 [Rossellomorea marisflavi]